MLWWWRGCGDHEHRFCVCTHALTQQPHAYVGIPRVCGICHTHVPGIFHTHTHTYTHTHSHTPTPPHPHRLLYVLVFLQFTVETFYEPARKAIVPMIVPKCDLALATTLDTFCWSITGAVGACACCDVMLLVYCCRSVYLGL